MSSLIACKRVKKKLANYRMIDSDADDFLCTFAATLGKRLNDEMYPEGINLATELLFYDLRKGISGFPGTPLPHVLTGQMPMVYALLKMSVPDILKKVLSLTDAERVLAVMAVVSGKP